MKWPAMTLLLLAGYAVPFSSAAQIKISPYLIGQNAWEKKSVFKVKDQIAAVKYQAIRIGGNTYEKADFYSQTALELIDFVRSAGAEPIVQLPRQLKDNDQAYQAVAWINGKMKKHIRFWSIGNEPDHKNQRASEEEVRDYFTKISAQIKRYDPEAIVMGFDLSSYKLPYLDRLLGGDLDVTGKVPGKDYYYLDKVTFHNYKFRDISKFEADVKDLKARLAQFNARRPENQQIGWAITEFNSHWLVDPKLDEEYLPYTFHNGQIFAEMYDLGMREGAFTICPWSMLEGGADREGTDLSLFDLQDGKYLPRSNYYHTKLLAEYMKGTYLLHSANRNDLVVIPTGDENGIAVMLLNKNKTAGRDYKLWFNKQESDESSIFINAGLNKSFSGTIPAFATEMLVFDKNGKLLKKYTYSSKDADHSAAPHESM
jgi:hypothetical protein